MAAGLTEEEKWKFDIHVRRQPLDGPCACAALTAPLPAAPPAPTHPPPGRRWQGFIVVPGVVGAEDLSEMCELCDAWHAVPDSELPPPLKSYDPDYAEKLHTPRSLNNVEYGADVFARHALNPAIMRAVLALTGNSPQHLGLSLVRDDGTHGADIGLHGGFGGGGQGNDPGADGDDDGPALGLRNLSNDYQASGGRVFASFINCATTLVDVPRGAGFVCVRPLPPLGLRLRTGCDCVGIGLFADRCRAATNRCSDSRLALTSTPIRRRF